ncbi:cellulose biosynthesis cyclic di-GMP-binding regulatory protein BcsB [Caloramator sp. ALD01]|uniref:cellulose biosynthesis cyclic di-GMP-binding regulatory protein BcsB n=1 Tax=Caloramator sp. ALD01 TaxID=1031288 RepID=UPI00041BAD65|nr:cellulose biosynthesis cyclic di-GMP-binding regulatory protein BcsB [Caloramator sp. ALD01]
MKRILKIFIILFLVFSQTIYAENIGIKNYKLNNNVELRGIRSYYDFNFYVDENWFLKDESYVYLNINISEAIKYKNSMLTVYLNGSSVGSVEIYGKKNIQTAFFLKREKMKVGFNSLRICAFKMIDGEDSYEDTNIGNWIEIQDDSYVHIEYEENMENIRLSNFPYPFLKRGNDDGFNTVILTGEDLDSYLALFYLSAVFGRYDAYSNLSLRVEHIKDFSVDDVDKNIIVISPYFELDENFKKYIDSEDRSKISNNALVKLIKSPYNVDRYVLIITSFDSKKLIFAAKALGDIDFLKGVYDDTFYVGEYKQKNREIYQDRVTLKDLGYKDIVLNGIDNEVDFFIEIPKDRSLKEEAFAQFNLRYSNLIDFEKSSLCIYVNDIPYLDKALSLEKSRGDSIRLSLKDVVQSGSVKLKLKFNLVPKDKRNTAYLANNLFAVILKDSIIYKPTKIEKRRDLLFYPAPLIEDGEFNDLNVVIPSSLDGEDLSNLSNIFAFLGHSIKGLEGLSVSLFVDKSKNNLIYGLNLKELQDNLYVAKKDRRYKAKENIVLNEGDGVIELIYGVYAKDKFILTLNAVKREGIKNISKYLSDFDLVERLRGNVCVINSMGTVKTYYIENEKSIYKNIFSAYVCLGMAIIVFIVLIYTNKCKE